MGHILVHSGDWVEDLPSSCAEGHQAEVVANWGLNLEIAVDHVEHQVDYLAIPCSPGPWVIHCSNLVVQTHLLWVRDYRCSSSWLVENLLVVLDLESAWVYQLCCSYQPCESLWIGSLSKVLGSAWKILGLSHLAFWLYWTIVDKSDIPWKNSPMVDLAPWFRPHSLRLVVLTG